MKSIKEIEELLPQLDTLTADDLEAQDLDFKEWGLSSRQHAVDLVIRMTICMANGGGGTVVFGVADKVIGQAKAILGVPPEIDINQLKLAVYNTPFQLRSATNAGSFLRSLKTSRGVRNCSTFLGRLLSRFSIFPAVSSDTASSR